MTNFQYCDNHNAVSPTETGQVLWGDEWCFVTIVNNREFCHDASINDVPGVMLDDRQEVMVSKCRVCGIVRQVLIWDTFHPRDGYDSDIIWVKYFNQEGHHIKALCWNKSEEITDAEIPF